MRAIVTLAVLAIAGPCAAGSGENAAPNLDHQLRLVERWLAAQRAYDRVPGLSAAVVQGQELIWSGASGQADLASARPARADTIYGICSISKLFTGIAVMQLRDAGKLDLHAPLESVLPWFGLRQRHDGSPPITLAAVLTHSAGLPREADAHYWMGPDFRFPSSEEIRKRLGGQETLYPADRYYQYSNLGLTLAGDVVAEVSGLPYAEYVRSRILQPLGLDDTDTGFPDGEKAARVATGYGYWGRDAGREPMPRYDTRGIAPAAGFSSTAVDLARFAAWQLAVLDGGDDSVLAANTLREMQRVQWLDADWQVARGLAFGVYKVGERILVGHSGDCPGFNTRLYLDLASRRAVVVMANANKVNVDGYAAEVFDLLDAPGAPSSPDQVLPNRDDYLGSYDGRPWFGEELVFAWKDGLAMLNLPAADPSAGIVQLIHLEDDHFATRRDDGTRGHDVRFRRDAGGRVSHLEYFQLALPRLPD